MDPKIMSNLIDVIQKRQAIGILGIAGLVWFSTWVFTSLRIALNIVFQVAKPRRILRALGVDLLMVGVVGILFLVNMILSSFFTVLQSYQGWFLIATGPAIKWMLKYLLPFLLTYCMFCLIYKVIPNKMVHFKSALKVTLFSEPALGTGQTSFRLVRRQYSRIFHLLRLAQCPCCFRSVGLLFFYDSCYGRGVTSYPRRRSTKLTEGSRPDN